MLFALHLPDDDPPVVGARGEDVPEPRVSPGHLPHRALVPPEVRGQGLGPVPDVEYLDAPVAGAGRQPSPVEVHLGVMDHVLMASVHSRLNCHHPDITILCNVEKYYWY